MNNSIIQSLWIGKQLSNNERLCLHSYLRHGHRFHLYAYDGIEDVPDGVDVLDANEILPAADLFVDSAYSYASFADWFRLRLLFRKGGWWVDMDTVCLQPFDIAGPFCFSSERHFRGKKDEVSNTYVKAPAGDPHLGSILQCVEKRLEETQRRIQWGDLGVFLLRGRWEEMQSLHGYVQAPDVFCPLDYFNLSALICAGDYRPAPHTLAIHLWNEMWSRAFLDKNAVYHPDSPYEALKRAYLPAYGTTCNKKED